MAEAVKLAQSAVHEGEVPVGAVIVHNDAIVGAGSNNPVSTNDPSAHAEINAIRAAGSFLGNYRLMGTTLYVTLEPCCMCAGAILSARINRVVFGCRDERAGAAGSVLNLLETPFLNHQCRIESGVLENQCRQLLQTFFTARRDPLTSDQD